MIQLVVYDESTHLAKSVVERPIYIEYQPTYNDGGTFSITAQRTENNSLYIKKGDFVWIEDDVVGVITQFQKSETTETVVIKGNLCDGVLSSRWIFEGIDCTDSSVGTIISDLFSEITTIPNLSLSMSTQTLERITATIGPGNFLDILKSVCKKFGVGYKVVKNPSSAFLQLILKIYEGSDLSESVILSKKYESLTNFESTDASSDEVNFVRVLGQDNTIVDVMSIDYTVETRREYLLDCTKLDKGESTQQQYEAILTAEGQKIIDSHKGRKTYKGDYTGFTFVFGTDYNLGDTIMLSGIGESSPQIVNSVLKQIDKTGVYTKIILGESQKTVTSEIKAISRTVEKLTEKTEYQSSGGSSGDCVGRFIDQNHTSIAFNDLSHNSSQGKYDIIAGENNVITGTTMSGGVKCNGSFVTGIDNEAYQVRASILAGYGNDFTQSDTVGHRGACQIEKSVAAGSGNSGKLVSSLCVGRNNDVDLTFCVIAAEDCVTHYEPPINDGLASYAYACGIFGIGHCVSSVASVYCGRYGYGRKDNESSHNDWAIIVGGGTSASRENIFTVEEFNGNVKAKGTITPGGADYAETYEWLDGNPDNEDRRGKFVTLEGKFIRLADSEDDYILGAVSAVPSILGDTYDLYWKGKYKTDVFGSFILDEDDQLIISEEFDPNKTYYPQSTRKEKSPIGTHGKLVVVDDGTCKVNQYCKPAINGIGTYTDDKNYYRVIERLDDTHIRIVLK